MVCTTSFNYAAPGHSWQRTACSGHSIGFKGMIYGAQVMAASAMKMLENPEHIEAAKKEFAEKMNGRSYKSYLPEDASAPKPESV
jgi:aminobenzoyl-glutamate utilization protein B